MRLRKYGSGQRVTGTRWKLGNSHTKPRTGKNGPVHIFIPLSLSMLGAVETYIHSFQFNIHRAFMRHKLARLAPGAKGRLLDVGAGDQPYRDLFTHTETYVATNTRRHYGDRTDALEAHTDVWIEDAGSLPFEDRQFGTVCCFQVLSVVPAPERFFAEAYRLLEPGGLLVLTTDFLYAPWSREDRARYSAAQLARFAAEAGFDTDNIESFGGYRSLRYSLHSRYVRSYANLLKAKKGLRRVAGIFRFLFFLMGVPFQSLCGYVAFQLEKNTRTETDFTFNLLLTARKPR